MASDLIPSPNLIVVRTRDGSSAIALLEQVPSGKTADLEQVDYFPEANVTVLRIRGRRPKQTRSTLKTELRALAPPTLDFIGTLFQRRATGAYQIYTGNFFLCLEADHAGLIQDLVLDYGLVIKRSLGFSEGAFFLELASTNKRDVFSLCDELRTLQHVTHCEPELVVKRKTFSKTQVSTASRAALTTASHGNAGRPYTWVERAIDLPAAHRITRGSGSAIAVIDDGIDVDHPAFSVGRERARSKDFLNQDDKAEALHRFDSEMHGTACASVAVSSDPIAPGIAPEATLLVARTKGLGSVLEAAAIVWAVDEGADIISCSWGPADGDPNSEDDNPVHHPLPKHTRLALEYAHNKGRGGLGCLVVFAAGNGNEPLLGDGYASNEYVIAVGSTNRAGRRSFYSDYGDPLFCCFPSSDIRVLARVVEVRDGIHTADRRGHSGYSDADYFAAFGGTSAAAPGVAGVAALVLSVAPHLNVNQLRELLRQACHPPPGVSDAEAINYGAGILSAAEAVRIARRAPIPTPSSLARKANIEPMSQALSLHIGINNINADKYAPATIPPLYGCVNDADAWRTYARDRGYTTLLLTDAKATRDKVYAAVEHMAQQARPGDICLITYAGHGSQIAAPNDPQELDGLDETWLLYDGILIDDEQNALYSKFAAGVRVVVISDSCHSGTVTRNTQLTIPRNDESPDGVHQRFVSPATLRSSYAANVQSHQALKTQAAKAPPVKAFVVLLPACQDDQVASEDGLQGAFTKAFIELLHEGREVLDYRTAMEHIRSKIGRRYTQSPTLFIAAGAPSSEAFLAQFPLAIQGFKGGGAGFSESGSTPFSQSTAGSAPFGKTHPTPPAVTPACADGAFSGHEGRQATYIVDTDADRLPGAVTRGSGTHQNSVPSIGYISDGHRSTEPVWKRAYELYEQTKDSGTRFVEPNIESAVSPFEYERVTRSAAVGKPPFYLQNHPQPPGDFAAETFLWHLGSTYSQLGDARDRVLPQVAAGSIAGSSREGYVHIAHIDTGILPTHPSLPYNLDLTGARRFSIRGIRKDVTDRDRRFYPQETQGHGAATLALLAGNYVDRTDTPEGVYAGYVGAFPLAKVTPLKISESVVLLSGYNFARALYYAVDVLRVEVVTMSMAGAPSIKMARAVDHAYAMGVTVVCAAGNTWTKGPSRVVPKTIMYPARFARTIAAVGINARHEPYRVATTRSAGGEHMESCFGPVSANGSVLAAYTPNTAWALEVPDVDGRSFSMTGGGTSTATPQIAAGAALWLQHHRDIIAEGMAGLAAQYPDKDYRWVKAQLVREALFRSARQIEVYRDEFGQGILQADAALDIAPIFDGAPAGTPDDRTEKGIRVSSLSPAPKSDLGRTAFNEVFGMFSRKRGLSTNTTSAPESEGYCEMLAAEVWHHLYHDPDLVDYADEPYFTDAEGRQSVHPELARLLVANPDVSAQLKEALATSSEARATTQGEDERDLTVDRFDTPRGHEVQVSSEQLAVKAHADENSPYGQDLDEDLLIESIVVNVDDSPATRSTRGNQRIAVGITNRESLERPVAALVVLTDEDGDEQFAWVPAAPSPAWQAQTRGLGAIPLGMVLHDGRLTILLDSNATRSLGSGLRKFFKRTKKVVVNFYRSTKAFAEKELGNKYEFQVITIGRNGRPKYETVDREAAFAKATKEQDRSLLMLHGMFNTAAGTFKDLLGEHPANSDAFAKLLTQQYGGRAIAMNMPTIFRSFSHNVDSLPIDSILAKRVDVIANSRGTNVAREFVRRLSAKQPKQRGQVVLAGGPAFGTPFADRAHVMSLVNAATLSLQVAGKALGPIIPAIVFLLERAAKGILSGDGLTDMAPGSGTLEKLNASWDFNDLRTLYIGSNFEPTGNNANKLTRLIDAGLIDGALMRGVANDGIIPTQGTLGLRADQPYSTSDAHRYLVAKQQACGHFGYYQQADVMNRILKHLQGDKPTT